MAAIRLNTSTGNQLQSTGLEALKDALGVVGTLRFLEQYDNGSGDFTKEKYDVEDEVLSKEEILEMFKK